MTWHYLPELPKPNIEVLAEVQGLDFRYTVVKTTGDEDWWFEYDYEQRAWWANPLIVKRWTYIEEE